MNEQIIKGQWNEIKNELKAKWGKLTDDQLMELEGNGGALFGLLQKNYGYTKDQVKEQVNEYLAESKGQMRHFLQDVSAKFNGQFDEVACQMKHYSAKGCEVLKNNVQKNPLLALGVALTAGVLIGSWLRK